MKKLILFLLLLPLVASAQTVSIGDLNATWDDAAETYNAVQMSVTSTGHAAGSSLFRLNKDGTPMFRVDDQGNIVSTGRTESSVANASGAVGHIFDTTNTLGDVFTAETLLSIQNAGVETVYIRSNSQIVGTTTFDYSLAGFANTGVQDIGYTHGTNSFMPGFTFYQEGVTLFGAIAFDGTADNPTQPVVHWIAPSGQQAFIGDPSGGPEPMVWNIGQIGSTAGSTTLQAYSAAIPNYAGALSNRDGHDMYIRGGDAYDSGAVDRDGGKLILHGGERANGGDGGGIDVFAGDGEIGSDPSHIRLRPGNGGGAGDESSVQVLAPTTTDVRVQLTAPAAGPGGARFYNFDGDNYTAIGYGGIAMKFLEADITPEDLYITGQSGSFSSPASGGAVRIQAGRGSASLGGESHGGLLALSAGDGAGDGIGGNIELRAGATEAFGGYPGSVKFFSWITGNGGVVRMHNETSVASLDVYGSYNPSFSGNDQKIRIDGDGDIWTSGVQTLTIRSNNVPVSNGGDIQLLAGSTTGGTGGDISVLAGDGFSARGGLVDITGGDGDSSGQPGGTVTVTAGSAFASPSTFVEGGSIELRGGSTADSNKGGGVAIIAKDGGDATSIFGEGGDVSITAGDGFTMFGGQLGGGISLSAGAGGGDGNGGDIELTPGAATSGSDGTIYLVGDVNLRDGLNANEFQVYKEYTSDTDFERITIGHVATGIGGGPLTGVIGERDAFANGANIDMFFGGVDDSDIGDIVWTGFQGSVENEYLTFYADTTLPYIRASGESFRFRSDTEIQWTSNSADASAVADVGLKRWLGGELKVTDGSTGVGGLWVDELLAEATIWLSQETSPAYPTIAFGDGDSGIHEQSDDVIAITANAILMATGVTVAALPGAPTVGMVSRVTDGDSGLTWGATVINSGGGATPYVVWYNGTNWTVMGK